MRESQWARLGSMFCPRSRRQSLNLLRNFDAVTIALGDMKRISIWAAGLLIIGAAIAPSTWGLTVTTAAAGTVRCAEPVSDMTAAALKSALLADYPRPLRATTVVGPLRRAPLFVCRYGRKMYAKATFTIPGRAATKVKFVRARGRWRASVGSNAALPFPCAIRRAFKEVQGC